MSTGPNDFDELQKLLALKRREQPPRQYFARFSDDVLHNLDAPERPETMSWLQRLGVPFDVSPAVVGAGGLLVSILLVTGIGYAMRPGGTRGPEIPPEPLDVGPVALGHLAPPNPMATQPPKPAVRPEDVPKSTEPVTTSDYPLFNGENPNVKRVNFSGGTKQESPPR